MFMRGTDKEPPKAQATDGRQSIQPASELDSDWQPLDETVHRWAHIQYMFTGGVLATDRRSEARKCGRSPSTNCITCFCGGIGV
jgi:hypothetical protein